MRPIDANRALEIVRDQGIAHPNAYHLTNYATLILREAPTIDVAPVKHGRWLYKHRHRGGFRTYEGYDEFGEKHSVRVDERYEIDEPYCSECGKWNESVWLNYCPNCGAKMDGGVEDARL